MSGEVDFIPFAIPDVGDREIEAVAAAMRSGWLTTGPNAAAFEREFAAYLDGDDIETVAVNSATAGLHLALEALGIGPGDQVLVPTWTFTASAEVVRYVGADPVFVDVDAATLNIDLSAAEAAITPRTRAVIPVHFAGRGIERHSLTSFAARTSLAVVEDAAHAFPARTSGRLIGDSASEATVLSFYATKTMTTGEGGLLATRDRSIAQRARTMRLHGISRDVFDRYHSKTASWRYEVVAPGFKYNLPDGAAAMGRVQLARAEHMRARREAIARQYDEAFGDLPLRLPAHAADRDVHSWHLYVVRLEDGALSRDEFVEAMYQTGVATSVHFIPLHMHPYWRESYDLQDAAFPIATREFDSVVSLPISSAMSDAQVTRVVDVVQKLLS